MADYTPNPLHEDIRKAVREMMEPFDDQYWMEHDVDHAFPWEFYNAVAKAGWLGITIPEEYGGGGLGVTEASIVGYEISASGGGMNACSAVHIGIFGFAPVTDTTPNTDAKAVLTSHAPDVEPAAANMVAEGNPNAD